MRTDRHGRGSREIYSTTSFQEDLADAEQRVRGEWGPALAEVVITIADIPPLQLPIALGAVTGSSITIYRRPIQLRAQAPEEMRQLIFNTLVEQVAEILGIDPMDVHDDYGSEEW